MLLYNIGFYVDVKLCLASQLATQIVMHYFIDAELLYKDFHEDVYFPVFKIIISIVLLLSIAMFF